MKRLFHVIFKSKTAKEKLKSSSFISIISIKDTSLRLGCLTFVPNNENRIKVLYKGDDIFRGSPSVSLINKIVEEVGDEGLDYLLSKEYRFVSQIKNVDIIDNLGQRIGRMDPSELKHFVRIHRQSLLEKEMWLLSAVADIKDNLPLYRYDPKETEKIFGEFIPPSKPFGLSPDFSTLPKYLYNKDPRFGKVRIKMTGSRELDFNKANELVDLKFTPREEGFVWHHLDDVTIEEASGDLFCTMQLIPKYIHKKIVVESLKGQIQKPWENLVAGGHVGSVAIWRRFYLIDYK